jgi:polysaccharide export outer membrane protein
MMLDREAEAREKNPPTSISTRQPGSSPASLRRTAPSTKPADDSYLTKLYRVGPGDVLEVRLTNDVATQPALLTITSGGLLEHPELSAPLRCSGLTVEEVTAIIEDDLKRHPSIQRPNVSVAVNEYASHTIIVSGLVKEPGPKIIKREAIPLYVVAADAQPLPEAANVTVLRHEPSESYVIDSLKPSDLSMLVRPGDVITFQSAVDQFFYVDGEVKSPGEKSFRPGLTLTQAIIAAGGLSKDSKEARLARDNGKGFLIVSRYKLKDINSGKIRDPTILSGDRITITK